MLKEEEDDANSAASYSIGVVAVADGVLLFLSSCVHPTLSSKRRATDKLSPHPPDTVPSITQQYCSYVKSESGDRKDLNT